jgi:predicted RNase H-like nuclease
LVKCLAWAQGGPRSRPNETGVAVIDGLGRVIDCGWTRGLEETMSWLGEVVVDGASLCFVDAPLVVDNPTGRRPCEREVGRRYGRAASSPPILPPRTCAVRMSTCASFGAVTTLSRSKTAAESSGM